jgi:peroxiredoxin
MIFAAVATAVPQEKVSATVQPENQRKVAPQFELQDSDGKAVKMTDYKGKIVLLDFWATWCHGCKQEIPWFSKFERRYKDKGLSVVGVSLDEDGWKAVKPFIGEAIPYRIVLGNDSMAKQFGVDGLPVTFLIDRQGRFAATYAGLVDKDNVEANIKALLEKH